MNFTLLVLLLVLVTGQMDIYREVKRERERKEMRDLKDKEL